MNTEKNPRNNDENQQQTKPTNGTGQESNPSHNGGRRALSPLRHPCSSSSHFPCMVQFGISVFSGVWRYTIKYVKEKNNSKVDIFETLHVHGKKLKCGMLRYSTLKMKKKTVKF